MAEHIELLFFSSSSSHLKVIRIFDAPKTFVQNLSNISRLEDLVEEMVHIISWILVVQSVLGTQCCVKHGHIPDTIQRRR